MKLVGRYLLGTDKYFVCKQKQLLLGRMFQLPYMYYAERGSPKDLAHALWVWFRQTTTAFSECSFVTHRSSNSCGANNSSQRCDIL